MAKSDEAVFCEAIRRWRKDPLAFVREVFKAEPDEWQKDYLLAYVENQRVAAKACKGPGKTAVLAWVVWHFLVCFEQPKIIATSISGENLRDGLWTELAKWQQKSEWLLTAFTWRAERVVLNDEPETWYATARRWQRDATGEQQANTLAGLHADNILFVVDEAGGVPDAVVAAAEAALANAESEVNPHATAKLLIMGNPTHLSGPLYRACTTEASLWKVIEITGDPEDPKRSPRISRKWAEEQIAKYGRDNPWVLVNVFGRFPPSSLNGLIGPDDMRAAMSRSLPEHAFSRSAKILGVDVARQGDDRTVIAPRQGLMAFQPKVLRIADTQQIAGVVARAIEKWQPDAVNIDATGGWGYGVIDALRSWGHNVTDVQFAGKSISAQYFNKRAEMAFSFADWVKHGGCLPDLPELVEEGTATTYSFKGDKMIIVEKEQIKQAIGRSPDLFDAYALTFANPVLPKSEAHDMLSSAPYDPLAEMYSPLGRSNFVEEYNPLR